MGVNAESNNNKYLFNFPFRYITILVPQHIVLLYGNLLPLINIPKSTFRSSSRKKRMRESEEGNVGM
jgi:hypothetical protein